MNQVRFRRCTGRSNDPAIPSLLPVLLAAAIGLSAQVIHAQTTVANFDTLDVRHDLSKSTSVRFEAARSHAIACMYEGRSEELRNTALLLLELATASKRDTLLASANTVVAYSCWGSDPGAGLQYLFKAEEYAQRGGSQEQIGWVEKEIGVVFKQTRQFREAITFMKRAEGKITALGEVNRTACHMSECYSGLGMLDSALFYAQRSNVITKPANDAFGFARAQLVLGKAYAAKGDRAMAELFFQKAIAVSDTFRVFRAMTQALTGLGRVKLSAGDTHAAIALGARSLEVSQRSADLPASLEATDLLEQAYHAAGRADSAYSCLKLHAALQDSVFNSVQLSKLENMRFKQQLKEKEDEAALSEVNAERSRNIQYGIIGLITITLIIFVLLLSRSSIVGARAIKNLSLVALLLVFEFLNLLLHPVLDRITDHSPLLMLLAMVCIAGLLIPLHHRMEKLITNMLVSKNNRVRLEAAKKTIEELEGGNSSDAGH